MKTFLKLLLFAALCILFANVIITLGECIFDLDALWFRHGEKMNLYSLLAMFLSILPCVLLKQWGIALGSRMSGWRLAEMSFLGFGLHRNAENRLRLMFRRPVSTVAILVTPPRLDGSSPYLAFILGPVLLLAPIGFATIAVSVLLRQTPDMYYLFISGCFMVLMGLAELLPIYDSGVILTLRRLRLSENQRRAMEQYRLVYAENRRGQSISCMPEAAFRSFPPEALTSPLVFTAQNNVCTRLLGDGRYGEALAHLKVLMDRLPDPALHMKRKATGMNTLTISAAIAEIMAGETPHYAARLDDPGLAAPVNDVYHERWLLACYLRALLVNREEEDAAALLSDLESRLSTQPETAVVSLRRIITDAQSRAAKKEAPHV